MPTALDRIIITIKPTIRLLSRFRRLCSSDPCWTCRPSRSSYVWSLVAPPSPLPAFDRSTPSSRRRISEGKVLLLLLPGFAGPSRGTSRKVRSRSRSFPFCLRGRSSFVGVLYREVRGCACGRGRAVAGLGSGASSFRGSSVWRAWDGHRSVACLAGAGSSSSFVGGQQNGRWTKCLDGSTPFRISRLSSDVG